MVSLLYHNRGYREAATTCRRKNISLRQDFEEKDLEDALERNITQFLLELGNGFVFMGHQKVIHPSEDRIVLIYDFATDTAARKLATIAIVAAGYGGDMPEDLTNELLDDMDSHYNKVKCRKIEQLLPRLNQMVTEEMI